MPKHQLPPTPRLWAARQPAQQFRPPMREHPLRATAEWLAFAAVVLAIYVYVPAVA